MPARRNDRIGRLPFAGYAVPVVRKHTLRSVRRRFRNFRDEPVPFGGNRFDQVPAVMIAAQSLTKGLDGFGEIRVLDNGVRPYRFHELVFRYQTAPVSYETHEDIEGLWCKGHRRAVVRQLVLRDVKPERFEQIDIFRIAVHFGPEKTTNKLRTFSQDIARTVK